VGAGSGSMTRGPTPSFLIGPISCRRAWPRRPALGATKTTRRPRICMGKTKNVLAAAKRLVRTARTLGRLWFERRAHRRPVGALKVASNPPRGAPPGATRAAQVVPRRRRLGAWALGGPVPVTPGPSAPVRGMCRGVRPRAHGRVPTAGLDDAVRVLRLFCASAYARARTGGSRRRAWMMLVQSAVGGTRGSRPGFNVTMGNYKHLAVEKGKWKSEVKSVFKAGVDM